MATSMSTKQNNKLYSVALTLFSNRSMHSGFNPQQLALACFRDAKIFVSTAQQIQENRVNPSADDENPLDAACAPNLKRTHPINLMSRAWGDLKRVQDALSDLEANPSAEYYEAYGWGKPEVNQARALFPAVVQRSRTTTKVN